MEKRDPRGSEPFDYVAQMRNMNEVSRKNKVTQIKWLNDYQWLCDEYKNVEEAMRKLCAEKEQSTKKDEEIKRDDRSVGVLPKTTNGLYGWLLAENNDFNLEKYGSYIVKYPNPMNEVTLLTGNVPKLACGKGLI